MYLNVSRPYNLDTGVYYYILLITAALSALHCIRAIAYKCEQEAIEPKQEV